MGSDGTLGLRAIKEKGGETFVQEPASAKYVSMPESALDAGWADFVAPVESLPGKIIAYLKHAPLIYTSGLAQTDKDRRGLEKILILLRDQAGHDFSHYKRSTDHRRCLRPALFRTGERQSESVTNVSLARARGDHPRRPLVFDAYHALPHAGEHD